ncbi:Uncharacterised protein [Algoriella xinjiangensis]|uniref:hypothetical protein n=1 Tax=Algoriella xinjiangensis TaxID=684065 RepID=UPI000FC13D49|nr:hypothetical protein [Algoriella xinjiangensis]VDH16721.1 Uncharacterised protein [Algoriella xinjiangensis]
MGIYQIIIIVVYAMALGAALINHGKKEEYKYNFYLRLVLTGLLMFCLYKGGFFNQ